MSHRNSNKALTEIREERLQGNAEGASSAPPLASSSAASLPGRNECPGTHCSLIEQEEREDSSCRSDSEFEIKEKWQTCWCCRDQQRACRTAQASAEKLDHTGPPLKERVTSVPQRKQFARKRSRPCQTEKKQSRLSRVRDHERGESRWARAAPGRERGRSKREHREKRVDSMVKEDRFRGGEKGQPRRVSLREVEGSTIG